jgi:hypothetical protein
MSRSSASLSLLLTSDAPSRTGRALELLAESENGDPVVYGSFEPPEGEISVAGAMRFRFTAGVDVVTAHVQAGTPRDSVVHSFYSTATPLIAWAVDGLEALHASGVRTAHGVIALSGHSESGKTTIAHGLVARGHERFAEDAVAFALEPSGARAVPLPFTVNLRAPAREFFGEAGSLPAVADIHPAVAGDSRLAAIFHLQPVEEDVAPLLERLSASDGLLCLLGNAYRFNGQPAGRERQMLESYLAIAATTPIWRLIYAKKFECFASLLDLVEQAARSDA